MSSTRFTPPVPTFEEIGPAGASLPDRDGFIYPDENDIAATTNKKTLRSYISNLTRGITPTSDVLPAVIEYNGPVPDHGNAYPVGDGAGFADRTFTQLGIEGGGINEMQNYSDSGRFSVNDRSLSDIVNKGELGRAHGEDALSGHLLLQGIIGSADTDSPVGARTEGAQVLIDAIPRTLDANIFNPYPVTGGTRDGGARPPRPAGLIKISGDNEILSSAPDSQSGRVGVEALSKVALDIMLKATGKPNGPDEYGGILAGLTPSGVQYGTSRVDSEALRSRTYSGVAGLSSTLDETGPVNLPTSDGIGEDRYTNKSYGVTYNPLEGFGDLTSGVTSFALLATTATAAVLAVLGIFSIPGVGGDGKDFPTYSSLEPRKDDRLQKGEFRFEKDTPNVLGKLLESAGLETDLMSILNFYAPSNGLADYGNCVTIGFAALLGAKFDDSDIITHVNGTDSLNKLAVRALLGAIGLRFLAIALTSDKGYYMNLFREIMKDSGNLVNNISDIGLTSLIPSLTQSKVVRFVDTLARIGDLIVLQARAKTTYRFNEEDKIASSPYSKTFKVTDAGGALSELALKFGAQRIRGSQFGKKRGSSLGVSDIPSAHLVPDNYKNIVNDPKLSSYTASTGSVGRTNLRLKQEEVRDLESVLDAEYMPFYFQDLRTNEIVSFHAFLDDLSDSYTANYNSVSGYGRIEDIKMYKDTKRSVGCTFHVVATSEKDFEYMWWQINKLTTMVYPQWSQGRKITTTVNDENFEFTQPFSQVPNATPVIRVRVGDLIRSNYSRFNLKRVFGYGSSGTTQTATSRYYAPPGKYTNEDDESETINVVQELNFGTTKPEPTPILGVVTITPDFVVKIDPKTGKRVRVNIKDIKFVTELSPTVAATSFYEIEQNSIVKSFESTMGMGLAAVVTQLQFTWMEGLWGAGDDGPGHRAPRSCKVQMSFEPIHDIAPGLDHEGFNRAPIYPVGDLVNRVVEGGESSPYGERTSKRSELKNRLDTLNTKQ